MQPQSEPRKSVLSCFVKYTESSAKRKETGIV